MVDAFGNEFEIDNYEYYRKIQLIELEILKNVDELCRKHNIQYSLSGGTLLGAVRHGGFIPWDDDIDIEMTRENYERFAEIAKNELPNHLFYQDFYTDSFYPNSFAKVRVNDTLFVQLEQSNHLMHQGIFIDIFPIDKVPVNKKKKWLDKIYRYETLLIILNNFRFNKETSWYKRIIKIILSKIVSPTLLKAAIRREQTRFQNITSDFNYCMSPFHAFNDRAIFPFNIYDSYSSIKFEGYTLKCMEDYDIRLRSSFGDYMQLPSHESRVQHHLTTKVSFGKYDWSKLIDGWPK